MDAFSVIISGTGFLTVSPVWRIFVSALFLIIPILMPIAGGAALLLLHPETDRFRAWYCEAFALLTTALVWISFRTAGEEPVEVYSFTSGFSIDFRLDGPARLFAGMVSLMWPPALLYAFSYMEEDRRKNLFFSFYLMTYGITLGVAFASNLTTLYVFFEMLTLVTIPLVAHYENHESMYAGRMYSAYTIGGASLAFFAVVMGTVNGFGGNFIAGGSLNAEGPWSERMVMLAFLFGFFGFGVKAAVFPFFRWLPAASVAPTPVTALLHAVAVVNSGVFAVMRLAWYVYGPERLSGTAVQSLCLVFASFTTVFAAVMAVRERHVKRRLAYSTISNLSYMLFGILLLTPKGLEGGMAHMLFHGIMKMPLFLCAGAFMHRTGKEYLFEVNGVGKRMPVTFACYTIGALALTGIPLLCGFVSKWILAQGALEAATLPAYAGLACLVAAAFLCAVYSLTISIRAFFPMKGTDRFADCESCEADWRMLAPILLFTAAAVLFGIHPQPILELMKSF